MLFLIKMKIYILLAFFFFNQAFASSNFECDSIDENLSGMVCSLEDGSVKTISTLFQLGEDYEAQINFPSGKTWNVFTKNSLINIYIDENTSFSGEFKNKKIYGDWKVANFATYTGELDGIGISGDAEINFESGSYFKGELKNNIRLTGTYYWPVEKGMDKGDYEICYKYEDNGCIKSKYVFSDGEIQEGELDPDTGKRNGFGKTTFISGAIYEGSFRQGERHGYGEFYFPEGSEFLHYKGHWKDGEEHGFGETTWSGDGYESYVGRYIKFHVGEYKNGKFSGQGTYLDKNREIIYQGGILNGNRHGKGFTLAYIDGSLFSLNGEYKNDFANGFGKLQYGDGSTYEGNFLDGSPHGLGTLTYPISGTIDRGIFTDGDLNGNGQRILLNADGTKNLIIDINFKNGNMHGNGEVTFVDQNISYGVEYIDGIYQGELQDLLNTPNLDQPKRLALVIGNDNYLNGPLSNAVSDSQGMANQLEASNFDVMHVTDVDYDSFERAIIEFKNKLKLMGPSTTALFYYAGHASEVDGINYLYPINSVINNKYDLNIKAINMNKIMSALEHNIQAVKIIILDACRDNPFITFQRSPSIGLANMNGPSGTIISYSTSPGEVALDGEVGGYGIYTGNLISSMKTPNRTIEDVFKETRKAVQKLTNNKQTPWSSSSLTADFYFVKE